MTPRIPWRRLADRILRTGIGLVLTIGLTCADPYQLPDFGSSADTLMSVAEQRRLGRAFMQYVREALPVNQDPVLTDYIETLGRQMVTASGEGTANFHFFLIDEPVINAFAGPSGYIGVYSGLVLAAQTESELAAVIAHEIAHVTQNHLMRSFEAQRKMTIPATALLIAAAVLGAQVDASMGAAAIASVQAVATQGQINFTRANEEEADRIGITTLATSGHDPYAMPGFFQRLTKASRIYETDAPELLRTHPVTTSRIADAMGRAGQFGHKQRADSLRFHLARANLRQRSFTRAEKAVEHFEATLRSGRYRDETAERYGYALALTREGKLAAAAEQTGRLLQKHPSQMELIVLQAEIDRRAGRVERAISDLRSAVGLEPASWPLRQAYAEALMAAGRPGEALSTLEGLLAYRTDLASVYALLADAAGKAGQPGLYARYRAEALYLTGDLPLAIHQLEAALREPGLDFYLASKIQVRLEELEAEQRENKKGPDTG